MYHTDMGMSLSWSTISVWVLKKDPLSPFWTNQVIHCSFESLFCGFTDPVLCLYHFPTSWLILRSKPFTFFNPGLGNDFVNCSYPSRVAPSQYLNNKAQDDAADISVPVNHDIIQCQDKSMPSCGGNQCSFCKRCRAYLYIKAVANSKKFLSDILQE